MLYSISTAIHDSSTRHVRLCSLLAALYHSSSCLFWSSVFSRTLLYTTFCLGSHFPPYANGPCPGPAECGSLPQEYAEDKEHHFKTPNPPLSRDLSLLSKYVHIVLTMIRRCLHLVFVAHPPLDPRLKTLKNSKILTAQLL